jgi:putative ABC transport system ATP-binding protein
MIEAINLHKTYGRGASAFEALKGVNLTINNGESIAILGKSGSGKSTLMHLLALLDSPSKGKLIIDGKETTFMKRKDINRLRSESFGFVFQQFFMNPKDSVLRNVMLPLMIDGITGKKRKEMAISALESVELLDKQKNKATDLSGGQKQRVCIARAIVNNPSVIFADEPTGNLDSHTGDQIEELLFKLNKDKGSTLIIVTHDNELASRCDRTLMIKDGELV